MAKVSTKGYKKNSKDKNEPYLQIPSGMITMKEDDGTPLRKGPILGIDNFGNQQLMMPGADYRFPGNSVYEIPMAQMGGPSYQLPPQYREALQNFVYPRINETDEYTGYNPLQGQINQDTRPGSIENNDWWMQHELLHHLQNLSGEMSSLGPLGKRPNLTTASNEAIEGYYNRRDNDVNRTIDNMIAQDPSLQFIPRDKLRNGSEPDENGHLSFVGAENLQYADPSTLEGEARQYEQYIKEGNSSIFPNKKNGGAMKRVKIHSLPKAQGGGEKDKPKDEVIWTAGSHELWDPLPEMTPEESDQWMSLRGDAIPITGNFATNQQIYATYKRAKEMGLGYDEYMGKQMANLQKKRESIVPKPIPGLGYDVNELKGLSELPGSPFMYNQGTGQYYLPYGETFKIGDPNSLSMTIPQMRNIWEYGLDPENDSQFYAQYHNGKLKNIIDPIVNAANDLDRASSISVFEQRTGHKYDPNVDYYMSPEQIKKLLFKDSGKNAPANEKVFFSLSNLVDNYRKLSDPVPSFVYGDAPDEAYDILASQEKAKLIKQELDQPLAKFLGGNEDVINPNIIKRAEAEASDRVAEKALMDFRNIVNPGLDSGNLFSTDVDRAFNPLDVANTEQFRSFMNMDPKVLEAIVNSPFGSGNITLSNNNNANGSTLGISKAEAAELLAIRNAIGGSNMWSYLNEPTPVDAMIQGTANTLSWMGGNDNAEGPGTLGEMAHQLTGYQAQNKSLDLLSTIGGIGDIGGNLLTNTWNGVRTDVPTYKTKPIFHSYTDPTTANIYQGVFDLANDPVGLLTGTKAAGATLDIAGDWLRGANRSSNLNKFLVRGNTAGGSMESNLDFARIDSPSRQYTPQAVSDNKPKLFSPFNIKTYSKNPKTGRSVLETRNIHRYDSGFGTEPVVTNAKYWNDLTGKNNIQVGDIISTEDAKLHIANVFEAKKPKPSGEEFRGVTFDEFKILPFGPGIDNVKIPKKWTADE